MDSPLNKTKILKTNKTVKAQGAIEYLLLLAAAIIVVTIVVTFMISAIEPVKTSGGQGTYSYICDTLNSQTEDCGCYYGPTDGTGVIGDYGSTAEICCCKNDSLLTNGWNCSAVTCPQG